MGVAAGGANAPLYNWSISSYAPDGDVRAVTDSVMGTWSYTYDGFNRLTSGTASAGVDAGLTLGWTYDRYGNRWQQNVIGTGNATAVSPQLTFTGNKNRIDGWSYDAAGNLLYDNINHYTYDAENRIATLNSVAAYIYDAEGRRVAKLGSGGAVTAKYILGLGGEQVSELNAAGAWKHSNVFLGGKILATFEGPAGTAAGYHYHLTDWLGTMRLQTNALGQEEERCYSYPFGDGLTCTGPAADATEHHFTGKERDAESGLDYFGARYLSSNLGRFMTPDWAAGPITVPYASFGDPQGLNLYAYGGNNPNTAIDLDGHDGNYPPSWENANAQAGAFSEAQGNNYVSTTETTVYQHSDDGSYTLTSTPHPYNPDPPDPDPTPPGNEIAGGNDQTTAAAFAAAPAASSSGCSAIQAVSFIQTNQAAAATVAQQLGVPTQNVLGLSGIESTWGTSNAATQANNFFGLHGGANVPFATGVWYTDGGQAMSSFPSYLASAQSFAVQYGRYVQGIRNPTAFAQALVKAGFNPGKAPLGNPNFVRDTAATINATAGRMQCP